MRKASKAIEKTFNRAYRQTVDVGEKLFKGKLGYSPKILKAMKRYGDEEIDTITIWRAPVSSGIVQALNIVSLGEFNKRFKQQDYDKLYHLSLVITTHNGSKYQLEKNEIINIDTTPKPKKDTEAMTIQNVPSNLNIVELLENGRKYMKTDTKFFRYSASSANCQNFCIALIAGNGMMTEEIRKFVKQNTRELFEGLSNLRKIANTTTDMGRY